MHPFFKAIKFVRGLQRIQSLTESSDMTNNLLHIEGEKLRMTIQSLGPTYVKFGQILSLRYDLLPAPVCEELQFLLDQGTPIPFEEIKAFLVTHFDKSQLELIQTIDPNPIGIASLGQVHKATLVNGEMVAIKVQRPNMRKFLKEDLALIKTVFEVGSSIEAIKKLELGKFVDEFEFWTIRELDYSLEGQNIDTFRENFKDEPRIRAPKVYWKLTTEKILTTEFIDGVSGKLVLKKFQEEYPAESITIGKYTVKKEFLEKFFAELVYKQFFKFGFTHGDPHPSNILLTGNEQITFVDFGIVGKLTENQIYLFKQMVMAMVARDKENVIKSIIALDQEDGVQDIKALKDKIGDLYGKFDSASVHEYSPTNFLLDVMYSAGQLGIQWPKFLTLFGKILITFDGMLQQIDPKLRFLDQFKPLFEQEEIDNVIDKYDPQKLGAEAYHSIDAILDMAKSLPMQGKAFLEEIRQDGIPVRVTHVDEGTHEHEASERYKTRVGGMSLAFGFSLLAFIATLFSVEREVLPGLGLSLVFLLVCATLGMVLLYLILLKEEK